MDVLEKLLTAEKTPVFLISILSIRPIKAEDFRIFLPMD
jgi:hypothetical protein